MKSAAGPILRRVGLLIEMACLLAPSPWATGDDRWPASATGPG